MTSSTASSPRARRRRSAKWWRGAAAPWERWPGVSLRLEGVVRGAGRIESPDGAYWFDPVAADRVCNFFSECLVHLKGEHAGEPFHLLEWEADLVMRPIFGWKRTSDDLRRFRELFLFLPKKNGKSLLGGGLGLYMLGPDGEQGAEVYAAAADRDQTRFVFGEASDMVRASPKLAAKYEVYRTAIVYLRRRARYIALSSVARTKHGPSIHCLLFDEFHTQEDRTLYDTLRLGVAARRQPLVALITTAGDRTDTVCYEEYCKAKDLVAGRAADPNSLPVIFEAGEKDDWSDPAVWAKANPSLGHAVRLEHLENECREAQRNPRKRNSFLRLHLNRWTESRTAWFAPEVWRSLPIEKNPQDLGDLVYCLGLDLSATQDLTACAAVFRRPDDRPAELVQVGAGDGDAAAPAAPGDEESRLLTIDFSVYVKLWFWLPEEVLRERVRDARIPYDQWAREGWIRTTPGNVVDYRAIRKAILQEMKPGWKHLREIGYDPWNATQFAVQLQSDGLPMVEVRQGYQSLSPPSKLLEALVASGRIAHEGNPVMEWCVANAEIQTDPAGNIKPTKPKQRERRIDGVAALVTGLSRLMVTPVQRPFFPEIGVVRF